MPDESMYNQSDWSAQTVYSVAGNLIQGGDRLLEEPPLAALPYPRNQVFVGRDAELARLEQLLARPNAVVAISGLGCVGKTRLAPEFAHRAHPEHRADDRALLRAPAR